MNINIEIPQFIIERCLDNGIPESKIPAVFKQFVEDTLEKSELANAPVEVKRSFNELVKHFSNLDMPMYVIIKAKNPDPSGSKKITYGWISNDNELSLSELKKEAILATATLSYRDFYKSVEGTIHKIYNLSEKNKFIKDYENLTGYRPNVP